MSGSNHSSSTYELPMLYQHAPAFQFTAQPKTYRVATRNISIYAHVKDSDFEDRLEQPKVQRVFVYEKDGWLLVTGPIEDGWCANTTNRFNILLGLLEKCTTHYDTRVLLLQIQACGHSVVNLGGLSKIYVSFTTHE